MEVEEQEFTAMGSNVLLSTMRGKRAYIEPLLEDTSPLYLHMHAFVAHGGELVQTLDAPTLTHILCDATKSSQLREYRALNHNRLRKSLPLVHVVSYTWVAESLARNECLDESLPRFRVAQDC